MFWFNVYLLPDSSVGEFEIWNVWKISCKSLKFCYICLQYASSTEAWGLRKAILKKKLLDTAYESNTY